MGWDLDTQGYGILVGQRADLGGGGFKRLFFGGFFMGDGGVYIF